MPAFRQDIHVTPDGGTMTPFLALALVAALPTEVPMSTTEAVPARWSVFVEPIGTAVLGGLSIASKGTDQYFYLPVGLNIPAGPTELAVELSVWHASVAADPDVAVPGSNTTAVDLAVGPMLHLPRGQRWSGFFVEPKLMAEFGRETVSARGVGGVQLGVDVGFQVSWKALYFAVVVGAGAGYGVGPTNGVLLAGSPAPAAPGFIWSVNLNLVRVGLSL
jgi:hypothetical protein